MTHVRLIERDRGVIDARHRAESADLALADELAETVATVMTRPPLTIPEMAAQIAQIDEQLDDEHKFCRDLVKQREELSALLLTAVASGKERATAYLEELGRIETAHKNGHTAADALTKQKAET